MSTTETCAGEPASSLLDICTIEPPEIATARVGGTIDGRPLTETEATTILLGAVSAPVDKVAKVEIVVGPSLRSGGAR